MPPTLKDVAEAAGVSIPAVSKVLHGRGTNVRVSEAKASAIREAAERLKYYPNALARTLRTGRSHTVGLLFENFGEISAGPLYYVHLLDGVAQELFSHHYRLTILPEIENDDLLSTLGDGQLEGVIWCKMPKANETLDLIGRCPIPLVALNAPPPDKATNTVFVACDNEAGARLVVRHLAELGHQRILFVMEHREERTPDAIARREGFLKASRECGLASDERDIVHWSRDAHELKIWAQRPDRHTAIFAWNERVGAEILLRAAECGLRVPRDLSVVGFDSTRFCETTTPRLTAARQPISQMARRATRLLLEMIEGQAPENFVVQFPCTLDVRDSTACPPDPKG